MAQVKRVALVVGNSHYGDGNDVSGVEDAYAMSRCLQDLDFTILPLVIDGSLEKTKEMLTEFKEQIRDASVALFFYSGHGFQAQGKNYLIPTDGGTSPSLAVAVADVLQKFVTAPNAKKFVFLDACRDEKRLSPSALKGLSDPGSSPSGVLQAFAASPGQLAASGSDDGLSPYTTALVRYFREPGLELNKLFTKVRADVLRDSPRRQQTFEAGPIPEGFFFRDPVFVRAEIPNGGHKPLVVILNGEVVLTTDQPTVKDLRLNAGANDLVLLVSNGKTFRNGFTWERTEGWSYQLDLQLPDRTVTFKDHEAHPFKAGPHHGGIFMVARATLFVDSVIDPAIPVVTLKDSVTDIANQEAPVWAQDQDLLFEASIPSLNLSPDDILGDAVNLGSLALLLRPFLVEFLKTGKILGSKVADPDKTFVTVRGNKALKSAVEICMTQGREDRIRDLKASIAAAFKRAPNPFEVFDEGLNACLRATALSQGISFKPEDIRIWTALEDRSRDTSATEASANEGPAPELAADALAVRAVEIPSIQDLTAMAQDAVLLPRPDEVLLDSTLSEQVVQGVPIAARIYTFFSIKPVDDHVQIHARAIADLSDLQNKIGALIDTIPLPTDNCSHFGLDNVVARIWGKQITVNGDVATLKLNGDVDVWTCAKNPVPCSRIEFDERNVFGQTIRIPRLVFFDCNPPIKNRNLNQPFEATLPFTVGLVDPHTYALKLGDPDVNLGGALGGVTEGILKIAGVDVNAKVKEALDRALSPEALKQKLPEFLLQYDPTLTRAELLSNSGALALSLEMEALLDAKQLGELIQMLLSQSGN